MSKVARAARVASRQRPEIITGNKTISAAETGELFLFNYNAAATITVTLPPVREGAYFRFQFMAQMSDNNAQINIVKNAADAAGTIKGTILCLIYAGSSVDTSIATNKDAGSGTQVELIDDIHVGSYVECHCDGTNWQFSGVVVASARGNAVFDA
tara:strand:- start:1461 stop:1925 length:465 start_codon:yes stop_codon:yes gene_type:complete